ncbi:flagellar assembly protein FliH [Salmonella enterica]
MPTSDAKWVKWKPENLLQDAFSPDIAPLAVGQPGDAASDAALQVELSRLRKQAEQKGFAQGQQSGSEEGKKQGYEVGFQQGREEGAAQGLNEFRLEQQRQVEHFSLLIDSFKDALSSLDSVMPSRLVQVALMAVRSMLGESVITANTHNFLLTRIQQLLREENLLQGHARMWVSTGDMARVQEHLGGVLQSRGWELCPDAQMLPGGCRVTTDDGELDATIETRWNALCNLSREELS